MSSIPAITVRFNRTAIKPYLSLIRAPFLILTLIVVAVPASVAVYEGIFNLSNTLLAFGTVFAGHIAVNILNVASDYRTGIDGETDETPYSGGTDVLTGGGLTYRHALVAGVLSILVSALLVVPLVLEFGAPVLLFYGIGITLVVGYTDVFARSGLGELACGLGLTLLPTVMVGYIQAGTFPDSILALSVPMFVIGFNLLVLNEFPDVEADRPNGRTNIPIVFGRRAAGYLYFVLIGVFVASLVYPIVAGLLPVTVAVALPPVALLVPVFRSIILQDDPGLSEGELGKHMLWAHLTIVALSAGMILATLV